MTSYVYVKSEPGLWTTGFYKPDGEWEPEQDCSSADEAARRVAWLNGGPAPAKQRRIVDQSARPVDPKFEEFRAAYPKRNGGHRWPDAAKCFALLCVNGVPADDMIAGAKRYAAFLRATGKEGTEYVQQAATFLGRNRSWEEAWACPDAPRPVTRREQAESEQDKFERVAQATARRAWATE